MTLGTFGLAVDPLTRPERTVTSVLPNTRLGATGVVETPETRYTKSGGVHIAYQIVGEAPLDLVYIPNGPHHVELNWENPPIARFLERLAALGRLIAFDKRGTGMSDLVVGIPTLETRMDDVRAVMDAAESDRAVLFAVGDAGPLCACGCRKCDLPANPK